MRKRPEPVKKWQISPEKMDDRIKNFKTVEECEIFSRNVTERGFPALAVKAQRRAVELQVATHEAQSEMEKDALAAVYAYQNIQSKTRGSKTRAANTWLMVKRLGIVEAIQRVVEKGVSDADYTTLRIRVWRISPSSPS
jgi:hypothetical protein